MTHLSFLKSAGLSALLASAAAVPAQAAFFHVGSGSIDGSLCVGFDCVSAEAFGSDTIRLKENNLRIHFQDTSTGSFPTVDWRLRANDTTNGGASYFAIENASAGRTPFRVDDGARNNALYVDDQGDVGIGTSTPVTDIHITVGDTPTMRLEQNTSSGFAAQSWDIAGNETSFFIRDVTGGSTLPFRIRPGSPSQALVIDTDGDIGIGTLTADAPLHVKGNDGATQLLVEETNAAASNTRIQLQLENNGSAQFALVDTSNSTDWRVQNLNDAFRVTKAGTGVAEMELSNTGNMTIQGTLTELSDKNAKMAILPIDADEVLAKVAALPVSSWTYIDEAETGIRHIGPMAQDFYAAFGTGHTDKGISTLDSSGVALAAIQALVAKLDDQQREIVQLKTLIAAK